MRVKVLIKILDQILSMIIPSDLQVSMRDKKCFHELFVFKVLNQGMIIFLTLKSATIEAAPRKLFPEVRVNFK